MSTAWIDQLPSVHRPWRWVVTFDYSEAMVESIKAHIPSRDRKWCPTGKEWWFKENQLQAIESLCFLHFNDVRYGEKTNADPAPVHRGNPQAAAYEALHLLPSAPPAVVTAAYRALAKDCHPDRGGDTTRMQAINSAYALIKRGIA